MMSLTISQWGLILDLLGVLFLFYFGLPSDIKSINGPGLAIGLENEIDADLIRAHNRKIKIGAYTGLFLIFGGFFYNFWDHAIVNK